MIQSYSPKFTPSGYWTGGKSPSPCTVTANNFVHKSLSNWAVNTAVGCSHACQFCYVPSTSTNKLAPQLRQLGVTDPDADWGDYVFLRTWDEKRFLKSLAAAENTARDELKPDGNRAVMFCSTTDPYQVFRHSDAGERQRLEDHGHFIVRRALELIRDRSTLNVRILTRSPLARQDFDLFKSFGVRLQFGMSLPTLRNDLSKVYEPKAPAPSVRLQTLKQAKEAGIPLFVAMAPTYPESDEVDLHATLSEIAQLQPVTVFHEPINIRAENVDRIAAQFERMGMTSKLDMFATGGSWQAYALAALHNVERLANEVGVENQLHLWPDKSLGTQIALGRLPACERAAHLRWLEHWWSRISAWPKSAKVVEEGHHERRPMPCLIQPDRLSAPDSAKLPKRANATETAIRQKMTKNPLLTNRLRTIINQLAESGSEFNADSIHSIFEQRYHIPIPKPRCIGGAIKGSMNKIQIVRYEKSDRHRGPIAIYKRKLKETLIQRNLNDVCIHATNIFRQMIAAHEAK